MDFYVITAPIAPALIPPRPPRRELPFRPDDHAIAVPVL